VATIPRCTLRDILLESNVAGENAATAPTAAAAMASAAAVRRGRAIVGLVFTFFLYNERQDELSNTSLVNK